MNLNYIFILVFVIYFVTAVSIYFLQRKLLYHPSVDNYLNEKDLNHKIKKIYVKSDNDLIGWYHKKIKTSKLCFSFMEMQVDLIIEFTNLTKFQI